MYKAKLGKNEYWSNKEILWHDGATGYNFFNYPLLKMLV